MRIPIRFMVALAGVTLAVGNYSAQPVDEAVATCSDLLDKGRRLIGDPEREVRALGLEKLRRAEKLCRSARVPAPLRARALMLTTDLYSGDWERQRQMWEAAVELLAAEAPDSRLLPPAMEGLASAEFSLGHYDESLRLATAALDERHRLFGAESREYVRGLVHVAGAHLALAQVRDADLHSRQALPYAEQALEISRRLFGIRDGTTVTAASTLIEVLSKLGRSAEADRLQEEIAPYVDLMDQESLDY